MTALAPLAPAPLAAALDAVLDLMEAEGMRLRVWSVVISFFGDAVAHRGGVIRLSALQEITERLRLEPGALRTAMSRLARDGWLTRDRRGRASYYALTPQKQVETEAAALRIYAPPMAALGPHAPDGWTLALAPDPAAAEPGLRALGFGALEGGGWLGPAAALRAACALPGVSAAAIRANGAHLVPGLIGAAWGAPGAAERTEDALRLLAPLDAALTAPPEVKTPLGRRDAAAARCLTIHLWRRAALRAPQPPAGLIPADWRTEDARDMAARIHAHLSPDAEAWLSACDGAPDGPMPLAGQAAMRRFGV
ncbi:MAG: phenylacetic acid degradation operon negative regulatory protein [Paracoccaceae bacterium]|jgi:phenylacetic acid degradation operon negative regulatory protein